MNIVKTETLQGQYKIRKFADGTSPTVDFEIPYDQLSQFITEQGLMQGHLKPGEAWILLSVRDNPEQGDVTVEAVVADKIEPETIQ